MFGRGVSIRVIHTCGPGISIWPVAKYVGRWPRPRGRSRSQQLTVFALGGLPGPVEEALQVAVFKCARMQGCKDGLIWKYTGPAIHAPKKTASDPSKRGYSRTDDRVRVSAVVLLHFCILAGRQGREGPPVAHEVRFTIAGQARP